MSILKKINQFENFLFAVLLCYTFFGAIRSSLLNFQNISNLLYSFVIILFFLTTYVFLSDKRTKIKKIIVTKLRIILTHERLIVSLMFCLFILIQIALLINITAPIGWDVLDNFNEVTSPDKGHFSFALSVNPNNQFFFFMMYGINTIINNIDFSGSLSNSWLSWQIVNCIFIDLSIIILYLSAKKLFNRSIAFITFCLFSFSLALSPWILTPYTDTMVLPFISFTIFFFSILRNNDSLALWKKMILIWGIGMLIMCCFFMKPSSVVFFIAYVLVVLPRTLLSKESRKKKTSLILTTVILVTSLILTQQSFRFFTQHQSIISFDTSLAKPWTFFVMMGLTGSGGYSDADTQMIYSIPTAKEKKEYTKEMIKERIKNKGAIGYIKFLSQKNINNTANGDFDWGVDGADLKPASSPKNKLQAFLQNLYYPQSLQSANIRFLMHIVYLLTLIGMILTIRMKRENVLIEILKLTFIGMIFYLLLFEGGRSRYLIQFLPFLFLLSANGFYYHFKHSLSEI
ncbi:MULTISPECIES: glycosyltransferase family 39 protein [unclassified Enterococcus]|uniref:glycosyltransferase family 39 protein n=1 Tax=unclassified Enterococcus TaxID=2608891 RepID=UPI001CE21AC3|nr:MULTISPECIES: glycosyltransferase family 39 protein [unclassified Enterococcus]MCA5011651.1 glycosyltransferase family 39 protein [Enterococcus sp. S23]MCA5014907.1 glycosyltransferase family 39 protein [Enterococcus sp. S22(2020)]